MRVSPLRVKALHVRDFLATKSPYQTHQSGNSPPDHGDGVNARSLTNNSIISDSNGNIKNLH